MTTQQSRKNIFSTSILMLSLLVLLLFGLNAMQVGAETAAVDLTSSTKSVNLSQAEVSQKVTYSVVIKNSGSSPASNVYMTDTLPANVTYVANSLSVSAVTGGGGFTNTPPTGVTGSTIVWNGSMGANSQVTIRFDATVNSGVALGTTIVNSATIEHSGSSIVRTATTTVVEDTSKEVYLPIIFNRYPPIPLKPTLTATELTGTNYRLDWVVEDADTINYYLLQTSNDCTFSNRDIFQLTTTTYTVDSTDAICYRVAGGNGFGVGEWSNVIKLANANLTVDDNTLSTNGDECTTLRWDFTGISSFHMNFAHGFKQRATSGTGTKTVCPSVTTTYTAIVVDDNGNTTNPSVTINVSGSGCNKDPYISKFESSVTEVNSNTDFTISWNVQCATAIYYSVGSGSESPATGEETRTERLTSSTAYKIRVKGANSFEDYNDLIVKKK